VVVEGFLITGHIEVVGVVAGSDGGTTSIMVVQRRPVGSEGRVPRRKREVELGSEVRQRTKQDDIRASIGRRKKDTWPLLEVVARSGYASRDNQTHGVSFHRDHESKAERRIARRTHHDACVASGSVPPTTDLASFAPVPEYQDGRRGICCRGHGYSRNVDPAPPTQWLHRPRRRLSLLPLSLSRLGTHSESILACHGGPAPGGRAALCYGIAQSVVVRAGSDDAGTVRAR
jgi:hypothetical protein